MMKRNLFLLPGLAALSLVSLLLFSPATQGLAAPQAAQPAGPLQVQETNVTDVVAELIECRRKEGVLTVRIRLRNTGADSATVYVISNGKYDEAYVTANDKKYFVLRDSERTALAPPSDAVGSVGVVMRPKGTWLWWAKYPAPPAEVKKINYAWRLGAPFEDIPITDQ